jgi:hypothetical protein
VLHEVGGFGAHPGFLGQPEWPSLEPPSALGIERADLHHPGQGTVPVPTGLPGMLERVASGRRRDQAGERGGLRQGELLRVATEVRAGGGLDPVGAVPEVHGVQVAGEDLPLRHRVLELDREDGFAHLAG